MFNDPRSNNQQMSSGYIKTAQLSRGEIVETNDKT